MLDLEAIEARLDALAAETEGRWNDTDERALIAEVRSLRAVVRESLDEILYWAGESPSEGYHGESDDEDSGAVHIGAYLAADNDNGWKRIVTRCQQVLGLTDQAEPPTREGT